MPKGNAEPNATNGVLVEDGDRQLLRFTRRYAASRAEVWDAITDPDRMERWAFRGVLEPRVGGSVRFDLGEAGESLGTVLAWDEPSVLEYEWGEPDSTWRIRFELTAVEGATQLKFDHFLPNPAQPEFGAGWHWHLDRLGDLLAGGTPAQVDSDEWFDLLLERYRSASK